MTTSALIIMLSSWIIITFFTAKFFIKILKTPQKDE